MESGQRHFKGEWNERANGWDWDCGLEQRIAQYANIWPNYYLDQMEWIYFYGSKAMFWPKRYAKKAKMGTKRKEKDK
jgi:hypothetical protein